MRPVSNPPNPWHSAYGELLEPAPPARLEVLEERARSILTENDSPDVGFRFGVNPYRGCMHGCAYCYARPTHQYLDLGAGTDFDRKIVVKVNAPELLREHFEKPSWKGELVCFSGNTDCYQPLEATYELTRKCLEVCLAFRNPVSIITKGRLVQRDAELLAELAKQAGAAVWLSIAFAEESHAKALDPWAPPLERRYETLRVLSAAGVPVGVSVSPVIPGLNDGDFARVLERAREAGATRAFLTLLRLPAETRVVFEERLRDAMPERAERVLRALRELREGQSLAGRFGERGRGTGPRWEMIQQLFHAQCRRLGYADEWPAQPQGTFRRPTRQRSLFEDP